MKNAHSHILHTLTLFTSFGTLFCCALPALFVTLGAGAVLAGIVSNVPQLIWLSEHKVALFISAGFMLTFSGLLRYRSRNAPCPVNANTAMACSNARRFSGIVYGISLTIYATGVFFAFIAPWIL